MHWCPGNAHTKRQPASAGTLWEGGRGGPFRLTSTEARLFIRDGNGGGGGGGGGEGRESEGSTADTARKTGETVDRRQNNGKC